jgi:hypothetical protein
MPENRYLESQDRCCELLDLERPSLPAYYQPYIVNALTVSAHLLCGLSSSDSGAALTFLERLAGISGSTGPKSETFDKGRFLPAAVCHTVRGEC